MTKRRTHKPVSGGATFDLRLTPSQQKAMRHILANGDDLAMKGRQWKATKIELHRLGLLRRRIGDWAWIPTEAAKTPNVRGKRETP